MMIGLHWVVLCLIRQKKKADTSSVAADSDDAAFVVKPDLRNIDKGKPALETTSTPIFKKSRCHKPIWWKKRKKLFVHVEIRFIFRILFGVFC